MSQTLAPGALDSKADSKWPDMSSLKSGGAAEAAGANLNGVMTSAFGYPFDYSYGTGGEEFMKHPFRTTSPKGLKSGNGSADVTPGDTEWASLIDANQRDEGTTS